MLRKPSYPKSAIPPPTSDWTRHRKPLTIDACIRVMDRPADATDRENAVRIYCDWMIDQFLKERGTRHGKSLGVL